MKTFLSRPVDRGRPFPERLPMLIEKAADASPDDAALIQALHSAFQKALHFDHIIFISPDSKSFN